MYYMYPEIANIRSSLQYLGLEIEKPMAILNAWLHGNILWMELVLVGFLEQLLKTATFTNIYVIDLLFTLFVRIFVG